ncbi:MAG: hypothetical protein V1749_03780 [Candidatus Desantisbacteria bacterium]
MVGNPITGTIAITGSFDEDKVAPNSPINLIANYYNPSPWATNSVTFRIDRDNPEAGIKGAWYKLGGTPTTSTDGSFSESSPFYVNVTGEGIYPLYVWLEDSSSNKDHNSASVVDLRYDPTPPSLPATPTANGSNPSPWTGTPTFTINWENPTDTFGIKGAWYKVGTTAPTTPTDGIFAGTGTKPISVNVAESGFSGTKTVFLWLEDNAGNISTKTVTVFLRYDTSSPAGPGTLTADGSNTIPWKGTTTPFEINWTDSQDDSGIKGAWYKLDNSPISSIDGSYTTNHSFFIGTPTAGTQGTRGLYVWLEDNVGNKDKDKTMSVILRYDLTPPAPPTGVEDNVASWNPYGTPTFHWGTATDISGILYYEYGTGSIKIGTTANTSITLPSQSNGTHTFYVKAVNGSLLISDSATHTCYIDTTPPGTVTGVAGIGTWSATNMPTFNWASATNTVSGIIGYRYRIDGIPTDTIGTATDTATTTVTFGTQSDGTHIFYVCAVTGAGRSGVVGSFTFYIDTTNPGTPTISSPTHQSAVWTANNNPGFNWGANDMSGIIGYSYLLDQTITTTPDTNSEGTNTTISYTGKSNGIWYFHLRAQNGAGLWSDPTHYQINIDVNSPSNPTAAIAWINSSKQGTITDKVWQKVDNNPYFEWYNANDGFGSGIKQYKIYWGPNELGLPEGIRGTNTYDSVELNVPSCQIYYLRIQTEDNVGNLSTATTIFTFQYDSTSPANPTSTTCYLSEGTTTTVTDGAWQNDSRTPYFVWSGANDQDATYGTGSGIAGYTFYWGQDSNGEPGTASIELSGATYSVTTPVGTLTTNYLRIRTKDKLDNWSEAKTIFTFKYDDTPPKNPNPPATAYPYEGTTTTILNNIWQNEFRTPYFVWSGAEDSGAGIAGYFVYWGNSKDGEPKTGTTPEQTGATYSVTTPVATLTSYYLRVRTIDRISNYSTATTLFTFQYGAAGPSAPGTITANSQNPSPWNSTGGFTINWENPYHPIGIKTGAWYKLDSPPTSGADGNWVSTKPFNVQATKENAQILYLWLEDETGNKNYQNYGTITLRYDHTPPIPPTSIVGWTDGSETTKIEDNVWQKLTKRPYFEWSGATDGSGSGIERYYVYLGKTSNADPEADRGTSTYYQTQDDTVAGSLYYLRIKIKDTVGNISTAITIFNYKYDDAPPKQPGTASCWESSDRKSILPYNEYHSVDQDPYFEWETTDEHSGVAGYAVYWGTDTTGEPGTTTEISGIHGSYTITEKVGTYSTTYLRVRVVDNVGNWSEAKTIFIFQYAGIPPKSPINLKAKGDNPSPWTSEQQFVITWEVPSHLRTINVFYYKIGTISPTYKEDYISKTSGTLTNTGSCTVSIAC